MDHSRKSSVLAKAMTPKPGIDETIRFAEKILEILDEGRFVATYKFAVLLALMDLCFEKNVSSGMAPESITTRQLAEKIIEIYWPHTVDYHSISAVLRQNTKGQAEIPAAILRFRREFGRSSFLTILRLHRGMVTCCAGISKVLSRPFLLPIGRWRSFPDRANAARPRLGKCS
jgi:hypothetical protein